MVSVKFEIEKGIEIPKERLSRECGYPFKDMEVGDSFITDKKGVTSAHSIYSKANGKKFVTRKVEGGIRVWRIE